MRLFGLNAMEEISRITESTTGVCHLVKPGAEQATVCGARFDFQEVTHDAENPHIAHKAARNLCESCRRAAHKDALMSMYERADQYANA